MASALRGGWAHSTQRNIDDGFEGFRALNSMTRSELELLLRNESNAVDWKATGDPEKIAKTLAAYANDYEQAGSGSVVCGVEESKNPEDGGASHRCRTLARDT